MQWEPPGARVAWQEQADSRELRLSLFLPGSDFFHNGGGAVLAEFAGGVIDAALREGELASAGTRFRIKFVERDGALLGSEFLGIDAGQHGGAIGMLQEDFAGVAKGFDSGRNGEIQKSAHFGFVQGGIVQPTCF